MHRLRPSRLAWLPIPVLLTAMGVFWAAGWQGSHESVYLLLILNLVFSLLVCLVVAYLITRSFLVRGTPGLLLLGCGVVIWGPAGVVATAAARGDANTSITIYNSCLWLSGLCHLVGVFLSLRSRPPLSPPVVWLLGGYAHAVGAVVLVTLLALAGWMPTFFVEERGGTPVRQVVLVSAIIMFALTALLLSVTRRKQVSAFAYWYALALLLIAAGLLGVTLQSYHASILGWTGRATQALGGLYMLIAAVASVRESHVWEISLETALRESEDRYRMLFETAPDAIVVHRDSRFLNANAAALRLIGASNSKELASHTVLDFFRPEEREQVMERKRLAQAGRRLPIREGTLLRLDGQPVAVECHTGPIDFQGAPAVQTIIRDITERKRAEESLREWNATLEAKVAQRTKELEHRTRQLQKLAAELSRAEARERKRVAEILHEDLQQQIVGAKLRLGVLSHQAKDNPTQQLTATEIGQILRNAIRMSRRLSHELSPGTFYGNNLGEALEGLAGHMEAAHDVTIRVKVCGDGTLSSESLTVFLFRAAREMLSNVVRHAEVRAAKIRLRRMDRYVGLCVSDRGCGFDPQGLQKTTGFGLPGIRERVELLGGRMTIRSLKDRGTVVRIVVPETCEEADAVVENGNPKFEIRSSKHLPNPDGQSAAARPTVVGQPERSIFRQGIRYGW